MLQSSETLVPDELGRSSRGAVGVGWMGRGGGDGRGDPAARRAFDLARGRITEYAVLAVFVACLAIYEWVRWLFGQPPQPALMSVFSGLMLAYMGVRVWMVWPRLAEFRTEVAAHRVLRQSLDELGDRGYFVFEPPVSRDRMVRTGTVVVGPNGIFALTVRSFTRSEERVECIDFIDPGTLLVGGNEALANPVGQAQRVAGWVVKVLRRQMGTAPWVVPVVVCPGWRMGVRNLGRDDGLIVTNESLLAGDLRSAEGSLDTGELIAVCEALDTAMGIDESGVPPARGSGGGAPASGR